MKWISFVIIYSVIFSGSLFAEILKHNENGEILSSSVFYDVNKFSKVVLTETINEKRGNEVFLRLMIVSENRVKFSKAELYLDNDIVGLDIVDEFVSIVGEGKYASTVVYRVYVIDKELFKSAKTARLELFMPTRKDIIWRVPQYVFEEWQKII